MEGNRKFIFFLFGAFSRHHVCNVKPQSSTKVFQVRGKEQNHAKRGNILTSGCHPWLMNLGSFFKRYSFAYIDFNSDSSFVCVCVGEGRGSREYNHFPYPSVLVSPLPFSNDPHHFVGSHHGLCVWMNYLLVVHHSRCPKANPGGLLRNVRDKEMRMRPSCKTEKRSHWAKLGLKKVQQYRV